MVKIKQTDNKNTITVSSKNKGDTVIAKNDSSLYYSNLSKEWACKMPAPVDGIEYSAKYYAEKSKQQAILSKSEIQAICEQNIDDMHDIKDSAVTTLENAGDNILNSATQIYNNTSNLVSGISNLLSQTADINLSNITQTGINKIKNSVTTDLNGKADTDLTNITDSAKVMISGLGMPSDTYTDLTLGASGSTYTAPADGYFVLLMNTVNNTNMVVGLAAGVGRVGFTTVIPANNNLQSNNFGSFIPVKKGDAASVFYSGVTSAFRFRFVYAVGSESEAS